MDLTVHYSSKKMDWETPHDFFGRYNGEFHFTLDVAASHENKKCARCFTKEDNGLEQDWQGETVWCNPPYGKELPKWVEKCYREGQKRNTTVVMLIPSRTDTRYFHDFIYGKAEIRFIKGRLKFVGAKDAAPFPSMVVIYR
jgi:phage N-6-adenine-methyltransferase